MRQAVTTKARSKLRTRCAPSRARPAKVSLPARRRWPQAAEYWPINSAPQLLQCCPMVIGLSAPRRPCPRGRSPGIAQRLQRRLAAADQPAAVDDQRLPGDEAAGARGEHDCDPCDIVRITEPPQRRGARE